MDTSSLRELFELYLARSDLRPASVRFKRRAFSYFVQWFGDRAVGDVTAAMAEDYRTLLAKGRSKVSANGYLANFKPFWKWLRRHNFIELDPFDGVEPYRVSPQLRQSFSPDELARLIMVSDDLWKLRICLGLLGCRRGEMFHIHTKDVHLKLGESYLVLCPKKRTANTVEWELKDHAIRYVALPEIMAFDGTAINLHQLIVTRLEQLPDDQPYLCLEENYFHRLIKRQAEGLLTDDDVHDPTGNFQRMFNQLQRRAAISPTKRYHELRAAFATKLIDTCGLSRAADALGHASTQTTRKYDRKSPRQLMREIAATVRYCYKT